MTITNSRGNSIEFGKHFKLMDDFRLSGNVAKVNYSDSVLDGSYYDNTKLENQDYTIPFFLDRMDNGPEWVEDKRNELYTILNPKNNPLRIDFETMAGRAYYLNANLESVPSFLTEFENDNRLWTKGLIQLSTGDPYYYYQEESMVDVAMWIGGLEFPLEIPEGGLEIGYRTNSFFANLVNNGQSPTGMEVYFRANGTVKNPSIMDATTYEEFKIITDMKAGDVIILNTNRGKKSLTLLQNNVRTNIFSRRKMNSKFIQLQVGDNIIKYDAELGVDNLDIQIKYTPKIIGV